MLNQLYLVNKVVILSIFTLVTYEGNSQSEFSGQEKPNIILIYTDDQGIGDVGYNGNSYIKTPNIDKLARNGVIFENFYTAPVCSPSRASLLTGKNSIRTGIFDTFNGGAIMAADEVTIAEVLKEKGYKTGVFGKWHLGDLYPFRPQDQGFDETLIHKGGGVGQPGDPDNYFKKDSSYFSPVVHKNGIAIQTTKYCADVFAEGAIDFIKQNKKAPFFAYLAFNTPHDPFQVPKEYYDMYSSLGDQLRNEKNKAFKSEQVLATDLENTKRIYGMISNIDDNIGKLIETLKLEGVFDNTIIIFISDNGPVGNRYQMGLRGSKTTVYEAGIKVPAFMFHSKLKPRKVKTVLSHIDILPTVLDYCGLNIVQSDIDGISFNSILNGNEALGVFQDRTLYYHWQRGYPEAYRNIAVRKGDYKLVGHKGADATIKDFELFNIKNDPYEEHNINFKEPDKTLELKDNFDQWILANLSNNKNYKYQKFIVGSEHERVSHLSRNDARSMPAMWTNDHQYGLWDICIDQTGNYKITIKYREPIEKPGVAIICMAPFQKTINIDHAGVQEVVFDRFYVVKGEYRVESTFITNNGGGEFVAPFLGGGYYSPFTIEIERQ